jgi:hypothetical protein
MTRPEVTAGPIERARRPENESDWGLDGEGLDWEGLDWEKILGIAATHRTSASKVARVIRVSSERENTRQMLLLGPNHIVVTCHDDLTPKEMALLEGDGHLTMITMPSQNDAHDQ